VIVGVRRIDQLEQNLAATTIELSRDDRTALDELTAPPEQYPNWMIQRQARNREFPVS
jgi:aryl-alcohol dehydrogenase-like predicted oxidoreductase